MPAQKATTEHDGFVRAVAFERRAHEQVAQRVAPLPYGECLRNERLTLVYFANLLWVTAPARQLGAEEIIADADRVLADFDHRWVVVEHEPLWRALQDGFAAAGWSWETHVYMAHARRPDRVEPLDAIHEVQRDDILAAERAFMRTQPWCAGDAAGQIIEHHHQIGDLLDERYFAAFDGDDVCAYAKLRHRDGIAQVEDVVVLPEQRGNGLGRRVTTAALVAGTELEPELLLIVADDDGWPKELYARLGFDPIGRTRMYHLLPRP